MTKKEHIKINKEIIKNYGLTEIADSVVAKISIGFDASFMHSCICFQSIMRVCQELFLQNGHWNIACFKPTTLSKVLPYAPYNNM